MSFGLVNAIQREREQSEGVLRMAAIAWDKTEPGLGVRKNKTGSVWVLKYRFKHRQVMRVIGPTTFMTRIEARAHAKKTKWDAKRGIGPEICHRQSKANNITVAAFSTEFIERYAKPRKKSWQKDLERIENHILPALGNRRMVDIRRIEVADLLTKIGTKTPRTANLVIQQLAKMFNVAVNWGYLPEDFRNPAQGHDLFPDTKKTRWMNYEELQRVEAALAKLPYKYQVFFKLLTMTGCRWSEVIGLQWKDVNLKQGSINIEVTKNGDPHWLPLPQKAVELLKLLPNDDEKVFPQMRRADKMWRKIRKEVGLEDVRPHDFRHTTASLLIQAGCSLRVVGEALNHKSLQATNRYAHLTREHLREPLEKLSEQVFVLNLESAQMQSEVSCERENSN